MDEFLTIFGPARILGVEQIIVSFLASFVLCLMIAYVYRRTYEGLSYSRSFVQTLILSGVISSVLIMAIGNNLARGLGILGTLAIIRFRTHIRDPRDIIFLFASLSVGISCGASVFSVAVIGTIGFCLVVFFLHYAPFASRRDYEGLVRFSLPAGATVSPDIQRIIEQFCSSCQLIAVRDAIQGEGQEFAYQVRLRDPSYQGDLIAGLKGLAQVSNVNLLMQRTTVEL
jgi:hypothetical protein